MCSEDNQWHPCSSEFFFRNKKSLDGFNTPCKKCQQEGRKHPIDVFPEGYKRCTDCKEVKPLEDFLLLDRRTLAKRPANSKQLGRRPECKACKARRSKEYWEKTGRHKRNPNRKKHITDPQVARRGKYRRNYGITIEEYEALFEQQNGLCASCHNPETATMKRTGKLKQLSIDHCHVTGKVRALLCSSCNQAFGCLKEDPARIRALLAYAEKWQPQK
jgi:hypothetical protein